MMYITMMPHECVTTSHQKPKCLLKRVFELTTAHCPGSALLVLNEGNLDGFPEQRAGNPESVPMPWLHDTHSHTRVVLNADFRYTKSYCWIVTDVSTKLHGGHTRKLNGDKSNRTEHNNVGCAKWIFRHAHYYQFDDAVNFYLILYHSWYSTTMAHQLRIPCQWFHKGI